MSATDGPLCGRCGVYRRLHPTSRCAKSRFSWWWDRHRLNRHVRAWVWLNLSEGQRWAIVKRMFVRQPNLCWCDLADTVLKAGPDYRDDYRDGLCLCDVPLPRDVGGPWPSGCYCEPPND